MGDCMISSKKITIVMVWLFCSLVMIDGLEAMEKKAATNNRRLILLPDFGSEPAFDDFVIKEKPYSNIRRPGIEVGAEHTALAVAIMYQEAPILVHIQAFFNFLANLPRSWNFVQKTWPWLNEKYTEWKTGKTISGDDFPPNTDFLNAVKDKNIDGVKKSVQWKILNGFKAVVNQQDWFHLEEYIQNFIVYQLRDSFTPDNWFFFNVPQTPCVLLVPKQYLERILSVRKENIVLSEKKQLADKATGKTFTDAIVGLKISTLETIDIVKERETLAAIGKKTILQIVFSCCVEWLSPFNDDQLQDAVEFKKALQEKKDSLDRLDVEYVTSDYQEIIDNIKTLDKVFVEYLQKQNVSKDDRLIVQKALEKNGELLNKVTPDLEKKINEFVKPRYTTLIKKFEEYKGKKVFDAVHLEKCLVTKAENDNLRWNIFWMGHGYVSADPEEHHNIAGVPAKNFANILAFFNKNMNLDFLVYLTCFGGAPKSLDEPYRQFEGPALKPIHFPIAELCTTEKESMLPFFRYKESKVNNLVWCEILDPFVSINGIITPQVVLKYREFFDALEKVKSFKDILLNVSDLGKAQLGDMKYLNNIALIRLRGGKFDAMDIDNKVELLTRVKCLAWLVNHPGQDVNVTNKKIALMFQSSVVPFGIIFDATSMFDRFEIFFMGTDTHKYVETLKVDSLEWFFKHFVPTAFPRYLYVENLYISVDEANVATANSCDLGIISQIKGKAGELVQIEGRQWLHLTDVIITNQNSKELLSIRFNAQGTMYEFGKFEVNISPAMPEYKVPAMKIVNKGGMKFNINKLEPLKYPEDKESVDAFEKLFVKFGAFKKEAAAMKEQAAALSKIKRTVAKKPLQKVGGTKSIQNSGSKATKVN